MDRKKPSFSRNKEFVRDFQEAEAQGNEAKRSEALEKLIRANHGLILEIAKRYDNRGTYLRLEELFNEGVFGLVRAAEGFDFSRGTEFSTYATNHIRKKIQTAYRKTSGSMRLPSSQWENLTAILKAEDALVKILEREPTIEELAEESGLAINTCLLIKGALSPVSHIQEREEALGNYGEVADPSSLLALEVVDARDEVNRILNSLSPLERLVFICRYYKDLSNTQVDQLLNLPPLKTQRVLQTAKERIRARSS